MRLLPLFLAALLLPALTVPALGQIFNGGFEPMGATVPPFPHVVGLNQTTIPGWVGIEHGVEWFIPSHVSPNGAYVVDLACYVYDSGGIQQTFATTPGQNYVISFYLGSQKTAGRDGTCEIQVSADGTTQLITHSTASSTVSWAAKSFSFIADDNTATLSFRCLQDAHTHFAYLDGVGASAPVATEPSTWGKVKALYR